MVYNTKSYEKPLFHVHHQEHRFGFTKEALSLTTVRKAKGYEGICCFVTDCLNKEIIAILGELGIRLIALRSAGFDHVDIEAAKHAKITVVRVPAYSPEAVAEFATTMILVLSRKIITAYVHGLHHDFSLEGLMGFNLHQKTVGIIGTGHIGTAFAKIMHGFGCRLLAMDPIPNDICTALDVQYLSLKELLKASDIISLHCPLNEETLHLMNHHTFAQVKKGAMLINTGRGALCDTEALIEALTSGRLTYAGLDVYEHEKGIFFENHHNAPLHDALFSKLQALPNVLITPHQAFFTEEAVKNIIDTTIQNITFFEKGRLLNQIN